LYAGRKTGALSYADYILTAAVEDKKVKAVALY